MASSEFIRKRRKKIHAQFTVEELDAAETLLTLCHCGENAFIKWGAKRRRSQIAGGGTSKLLTIKSSPFTPLSLSWSETDEYNGQASPHPPLSLPQSGRVRTAPSRRAPKKKNHNELRESVNTLLSERDRLKEEEQKLLKTYQDLRDRNEHLKYELALHLDGRQEPQLIPTTWPTLTDLDLGQKTKTSLSFDGSSGLDEHSDSKVTADALPLDPACNEAKNKGKSLYPHSPECSSGPGEVYSKPTKDVLHAAIPDDSSEAFLYATIGGSSNHRLFSMNKTTLAAEASKQAVELI
ncbi:hypothetical protein SUGI_0460750 [Cryptomeria japonica]|uniref:uncharacterized protein LOC131054708 isoform X1 n=1 Tax=Cryptomeria japonica TaxID=3369 RepID=UPI002408EF09|nr:uncharacterized protein LOC131054708 isoform X1 [Cryptomeria japonica]GLJ24151.1 hypothetical protein SUGI_0460750 [Cryptomeria japonica]